MNQRLDGLDLARSLAVLGMMFVNYMLVFQVSHDSPGYAFLALFEGRAAAIFLTLAGIGIGLMTIKGRTTDGIALRGSHRLTLAKRSLFLWVLGLVLFQIFEWPADILHYYGAYMLLVLPVLYYKPKALLLLSGLMLAISSYSILFMNYTAGWQFDTFTYTDFWTLNGFFRHLFFNGFHPIFPWFAFLLVGLSLSHGVLVIKASRRKLLAISFGVALVVEIVSLVLSNYYGATSELSALFLTKPMPPNLFYMFAAGAWAVVVIVLCIELTQALPQKGWLHGIKLSLIRSGQMSLSHYVFHSAVVLTIAQFLNLIHEQSAFFVIGLTCGLYVFMVLFAHLWSIRFSRGPLELLMRRLTDGGTK